MEQLNTGCSHRIPKEIETDVGKIICCFAKAYFEKIENRRAFEKWYLEKYGVPYIWKTNKEN